MDLYLNFHGCKVQNIWDIIGREGNNIASCVLSVSILHFLTKNKLTKKKNVCGDKNTNLLIKNILISNH